MVLKWIEGFEALSNPTTGILMSNTDLPDKYPANSISGDRYTPGRWGIATESVFAWKADSGAYIETKALDDQAGWVVGLAKMWSSLSTQHNFLECYDGTTLQMALRLNTDGTVSVLRGTTVLTSTTATVAIDTWYYMEFKFTINNTTGAYDFKWDAVSKTSGSSTDTQQGSNANVDKFRFLQTGPGFLDDIYILTQADGGSTNFLAIDSDGLVTEELIAESDGFYSDWDTNLGTTFSSIRNGSYSSQDDDYARSNTIGDKSTVNQEDPNISVDHVGAQMNIRCKNLVDDDEHQITPMYRLSSSDTFVTAQTGTIDWAISTYRNLEGVVELSETQITSAEMGFRLEA